MTHSPTPTELLALKTANAALLNSPDSFCDLVATIVFALGSAQLLQSPETAAELSRLVHERAQWRTRYSEESRTYWDAELPPGGECCAECNQPVESEPCPEHHPATVAARLVEENRRLRARVDELDALEPATYQTCRVCQAGYRYGNPCSNCAFQARMAAAAAARPPRRTPISHDLDLPEMPR